ncbi:ParA family protein [Fluviispira sanaruensis]|uniref:Cobyric acid synthase n=1 Tax=Fluviispira sanaruensis TaxID=2493639 RepID=A0A4P2VLU0_FLUSA|nr:ParA family protein [Fluviispira sanaruensis]BBH53658.1 cobyric acid synthase [Fluviispira sanaruensis]
MTQIIRVIYNQKGGVGKTTLAVNLAACAAKSGKRTLLIDSDPQGNASSYILGNDKYPDSTLADYYESCLHLNIFRQSIFEYITLNTKIPNLHLVASNRELEDLRTKLENKHKIMKLREGLKNNTYEQVYLDPPPANDFFSLACLIAATEIIIPIDCDAFSIRAATEIKNTIEEVRQDHNPNLKVLGIVVNQFQKGTKHSIGIIQELQKIGFQILEPYIPSSVKIRESHSEIKPIVIGHPEHAVSQAIQSLFNSIENISQMKNIRNNFTDKTSSKENNSALNLD